MPYISIPCERKLCFQTTPIEKKLRFFFQYYILNSFFILMSHSFFSLASLTIPTHTIFFFIYSVSFVLQAYLSLRHLFNLSLLPTFLSYLSFHLFLSESLFIPFTSSHTSFFRPCRRHLLFSVTFPRSFCFLAIFIISNEKKQKTIIKIDE